jgi:hypothetical protein
VRRRPNRQVQNCTPWPAAPAGAFLIANDLASHPLKMRGQLGGPETAVFVFDNGHNSIEGGLRIQEGRITKKKWDN